MDTYFVFPTTLQRLRSGPSGPYIDGFARCLTHERYAAAIAGRYLRAAAHFGHVVDGQGQTLEAVTPQTLHAFQQHLPSCRCPSSHGGHVNPHVFYGAKRFVMYLRTIGILPGQERTEGEAPEAPLVTGFRHWLQRHRGVAESTLTLYCWGVRAFLQTLGHDPSHSTVPNMRAFFLAYAQRSQTSSAKKLATAVRAFVRYLSGQGHCQAGLDGAIPALAGWRLASLPRCLTATAGEQGLAVCAGDSLRAKRDRAILWLLARLGLRAGDVANLRLSDIAWAEGS